MFQKCREESRTIRNFLFRVTRKISSIQEEVESYRSVLFPEEKDQRTVEDIARPKSTEPFRNTIIRLLNFSPGRDRVRAPLAK